MFNPILTILTTIIFLTSCTISFQNISTVGKASDVVDENQTASPNVSTEVPLIK